MASWAKKKKKIKESYTGPDDIYVYVDFDRTLIGKFMDEVALPKNAELEDWLSSQLIESFNEINFIYAHLVPVCEPKCKTMQASPNATYLWADGEKIVDAIDCTAEQYIGYLMEYSKRKFIDNRIFPPTKGSPFGTLWKEMLATISKRLLRVYGHVFFAHLRDLEPLGLSTRFHNAFARYVIFLGSFRLLPEKELEPIQFLVNKVNAEKDSVVAARHLQEEDEDDTPKMFQALFPFNAQDPTMISFQKGDIIELVDQSVSEEWWIGRINEKSGYFPKKYVKPKDDNRSYATVLFNYDARDSANELTIRKGDLLALMNTDDPDWWEGDLNGQTGYFPKNFVEKIDLKK